MNATPAESVSDVAKVCDGEAVSNLAAFEKPYRILGFDNSGLSDKWSWKPAGTKDDAWSVEHTDFKTANTAACVSVKAGSEKKMLTCPYDSDGKTVKVDLYSA